MKTVAFILTVYNRKDTTRLCLTRVYSIIEHIENITCDIFLTNDGCTDGTPKMIQTHFPKVKMINGDGSLYWSGGMRLAWETAASTQEYDYYIWLNDDVILYDHSIREVLSISETFKDQALVCGAFCNARKEFTYGGKDNCYQPIIPDGKMHEVFLTNGNLLLIPQEVYKKLGNIPDYFIHDMGDIDYGLRAQENGIKVVSSLSYLGECPENPINVAGKGHKMGTDWYGRMKYLYSPRGVNPNIVFRFNLSHFGIYKAIHDYVGALYYTLLPDYIFKRIKGI